MNRRLPATFEGPDISVSQTRRKLSSIVRGASLSAYILLF